MQNDFSFHFQFFKVQPLILKIIEIKINFFVKLKKHFFKKIQKSLKFNKFINNINNILLPKDFLTSYVFIDKTLSKVSFSLFKI